jgi:hypothetical protein
MSGFRAGANVGTCVYRTLPEEHGEARAISGRFDNTHVKLLR